MPRSSALIDENLVELPCCSMLAHYRKEVGSIDKRLKVAEDAAQAQSMNSMNAATNKSGSRIATGNIEALDQFMAATTDDKLLNSDDRNNDTSGINGRNPKMEIFAGKGNSTPLCRSPPWSDWDERVILLLPDSDRSIALLTK
jgi:hypothetical protein